MPSQSKLLALALEEKERRAALPNLLDVCFKEQRDFIKDPSKRKALFVARRSGKSFAMAVYMIMLAMQNPRIKILYIGLNKQSAENVMWMHAIQEILIHYSIPHKYNHQTKTVSFDNGSTIRLTGADATPQEWAKLLGGKYFACFVDECQSYRQDLQNLLSDGLEPAVSDYINRPGGGVICLAGTPGNQLRAAVTPANPHGEHYWYRVTKTAGSRERTWAVHHWEGQDNPHMKAEILATFEDMEAREGPLYRESASFRQQWLCEWVVDDTAKVYKYEPKKNALREKATWKVADVANRLQDERELTALADLKSVNSRFYYILGIDIGWEDDTAFCVGAFSRSDRNYYIVESFKQNHIVVTTIANIIKQLNDKYRFYSMVIDTGGSGKVAVEEMRMIHGLPLKAAEKTDKESMIARMNSDFVTENIKVIESCNKDLITEWNALIVDKKAQSEGRFKEAEKYKNHCADAALYAFRESRHYRGQPVLPTAPDEYEAEQVRRQNRSKPIYKLDYYEQQEEDDRNREAIQRFRRGE